MRVIWDSLAKMLVVVFLGVLSGIPFVAHAQKVTLKSKAQKQVRHVSQVDEEDDDFVDRRNVDLSELASKEIVIEGAVCDACIYKIKSVLQESPEVFKVNHEGLKDLYIYFNKGKSLSDAKIQELVSVAGYRVVQIKPSPSGNKTMATTSDVKKKNKAPATAEKK